MQKKTRKTILQGMIDKFIAGDPKRKAMLDEDYLNIQIAQMVYDMRVGAGLSQRDLAKRVGTTASVICRVENADSGHSLAMLTRIAGALGQQIEVRAVPKEAA